MKEIYLDNSATTRVLPEVASLMTKIMTEDYGNPSSMHSKGVTAEKYIKEARETLAKILKVNDKEILFTSCGTESDNMALFGVATANERRGKHIITTKIEHPAILRAAEQLESRGFKITYLGTDEHGLISLDELRNAITDETILVSVMHVNNEIGSVQPVAEAGAIIKSINPQIIFHVDAVQSFGKFRIYPKKMNIDLLSVSGHKIHGPKGIGFLYINEKIKINPIIFGGGQQGGMRSGTESVPSIAGVALAAKTLYDNFDEDVKNLYALKKYFIDEVTKIEDVTVNGLPRYSTDDTSGILSQESDVAISEISTSNSAAESDIFGAPHVVSVSIKDVRAEVMLHSLEDKCIYVSAGSACSTHKRAASATLLSIGLDKNLLESTVRFSFSVFTSKEEIDYTIEAMEELIPMLRRYTRR